MDINAIRSRQADLVDSSIFTEPITIIGCGAIGSFTALTLAKVGFHDLTMYDNDDVSEENISNQFYRYSDIGRNKALALRDMLGDFENIPTTAYPHLWTPADRLSGTVIMAVDSMTVRRRIHQAVHGTRAIHNVIDGRMGGQQAEIYAFENIPAQRAIYERYLWQEGEAQELPCTQKAVMYNVLWIASGIANTLRLMLERKPFHNVMLMDFENMTHINVKV